MAKIKNPIQYTSRTFNTVLADINSDTELTDKPDWWKRGISGVMDVLSMILNAEANNLILRTSFTRQAVTDLLELIDYQITEKQTSTGLVLFYIDSGASFPFSIPAIDLVGLTQGTLAVSAKRFESRSYVNVTLVQEIIANTAVSAGTDIFTVSRVFTTGEKAILSGSNLPTPIAAGTEYWVIKISDTEIKLATTLANAYAGTAIDITAQGTGNITIDLYSFFSDLFQQETKSEQNIGSSDGSTDFQEFDLPDIDIVQDTLTITINSESYTRVDTLVFSVSTDKVFKQIYNSDGSSKIQFGNDDFGIIPPAFDILANYAVGGGSDSNVQSINRLNIYAGSDSNIVGISNPSTLTGGANEQGIEQAKILGPILLKTRDRYITSEDGEALAQEFGGISQVKINGNEFGVLSSEVIIIPTGGGTTSTQFKDDLDQFLTDRSILESIDIRVFDATYLTQNVVSASKILPGFSFSDIKKYIDLAWQLFFSETGLEIQNDFISNGVTSAVVLINNIFGTSFAIEDFDQISKLLDEDIFSPALIGVDRQESDAFGYMDIAIDGVDYLTISSPSFPIVVGNGQITTDGTITVTEIV